MKAPWNKTWKRGGSGGGGSSCLGLPSSWSTGLGIRHGLAWRAESGSYLCAEPRRQGDHSELRGALSDRSFSTSELAFALLSSNMCDSIGIKVLGDGLERSGNLRLDRTQGIGRLNANPRACFHLNDERRKRGRRQIRSTPRLLTGI